MRLGRQLELCAAGRTSISYLFFQGEIRFNEGRELFEFVQKMANREDKNKLILTFKHRISYKKNYLMLYFTKKIQ